MHCSAPSSVRHIEFSQKEITASYEKKRTRKLEGRSDHGREPPRAFVHRCRADSTRGTRCRVAARSPCRCHCHGSLSPSAWAARSCSCARDAASSCNKLCCRLASRRVSASSRGEAARSCSSDRAVSRWAARKSSEALGPLVRAVLPVATAPSAAVAAPPDDKLAPTRGCRVHDGGDGGSADASGSTASSLRLRPPPT